MSDKEWEEELKPKFLEKLRQRQQELREFYNKLPRFMPRRRK